MVHKQPATVPVRSPLGCQRPHDWYVKTQITLLAHDGKSNIIASTEPLDGETDTDTYVRKQGDLLRQEFPLYEESGIVDYAVDGIPTSVVLREFSWKPPEGEAVRQLQLYAVHESTGITATATCVDDAESESRMTMMLDVFKSIVVDEEVVRSNAGLAAPTAVGDSKVG